jgi:predicted transcriptional regulator
MKKTQKPVPTGLELELLKVIWQRGRATVREVHRDLLAKREIAYTTVLTMMGVLERKGHLTKKAGPRAYVYVPAQPREKVVEGMIDEFVERVFNGSAKPLLVHLVEDRNIPLEDLDEIEKLVRSKRLER